MGRLGAGAAVGLAAQLGAVSVLRERARRRARTLAQYLDEERGGSEVGAREFSRKALREGVGTGVDDELPDLPVIAFPAAFAIDESGARLARLRVFARRQDPLDPRGRAKRLLPLGTVRRRSGPGPERGKDYH